MKEYLMQLCTKDDVIYTSYFGNTKKIIKCIPNACLVSIAGKTPDWFKGEKYKPLMPHYMWWKEWHDMFSSNIESKESRAWYIDKYYSTVLNMLNPLETSMQLKDLAKGHPIFILCYETPEKFCHRHIVADWLTKNSVACEEWKV